MDGIQIKNVRTLDDSSTDGDYDSSFNDDEPEISLPSSAKKKLTDYQRPPLSYSMLAALAFKNSNPKLAVGEIYKFIMKHFPFYAKAGSGWKNSIRHNLSMHPCFMRLVPDNSNFQIEDMKQRKGSMWGLNPARVSRIDSAIARAMSADRAGVLASMRFPERIDAILAGQCRPALPPPPQSPLLPLDLDWSEMEDSDYEDDIEEELEDLDAPGPTALEQPEKAFKFTQFGDGVLPLITMYSKTPADHDEYSWRYPIVVDELSAGM